MNFIAFDVETPTKENNSICQIGFAIVKNGEIVETKSYLVQPPYNRYDQKNIEVHNINPHDTFDQPTFDVIWNNISCYLENNMLVAHNSTFDYNVLKKVADFYNIDLTKVSEPYCTCKMNNGASLKKCCEEYGITLDNHHDACSDAIACAEVFIKTKEKTPEQTVQVKRQKQNSTPSGTKIPLNVMPKKYENPNDIPDNIFKGKRVLVTGELPFDRKEITNALLNLGAIIEGKQTRHTQYILIGEKPGPMKMKEISRLKFNGYNLNIIEFDFFWDVIIGNEVKEPELWTGKRLKLNNYHLQNCYTPLDNQIIDYFFGMELFIDPYINGNKYLMYQMFGNLGAYANQDMDDCSYILISDKTWKDIIHKNQNETIRYIQEYYNKGKAISFDYKFILESDFVNYFEARANEIDDDVLISSFEAYADSISETSVITDQEVLLSLFPEERNWVKIDGKVLIKMKDGRTWCPKRQFEPGGNITIPDYIDDGSVIDDSSDFLKKWKTRNK